MKIVRNFSQQNSCGKLVENIKKNHEVVWQKAYSVLKSTLPNHAVHAWIDPIVCTGLDKNILRLAVPNHFFKEWIDSHYTNNKNSDQGQE